LAGKNSSSDSPRYLRDLALVSLRVHRVGQHGAQVPERKPGRLEPELTADIGRHRVAELVLLLPVLFPPRKNLRSLRWRQLPAPPLGRLAVLASQGRRGRKRGSAGALDGTPIRGHGVAVSRRSLENERPIRPRSFALRGRGSSGGRRASPPVTIGLGGAEQRNVQGAPGDEPQQDGVGPAAKVHAALDAAVRRLVALRPILPHVAARLEIARPEAHKLAEPRASQRLEVNHRAHLSRNDLAHGRERVRADPPDALALASCCAASSEKLDHRERLRDGGRDQFLGDRPAEHRNEDLNTLVDGSPRPQSARRIRVFIAQHNRDAKQAEFFGTVGRD